MKQAIARLLAAALLLACTAQAASVSFVLEDQFRIKHKSSEVFNGKPLVLLADDQRKAADHIQTWARELRKAYPGKVQLVGFVNLDGVPFFVSNNSVRNSIKETCPDLTVLCDWEGTSYEALGFPEDKTSVSLYDAKGSLVKRIVGELNPSRLQQARTALDRLLADS
jgi:hypothetical protein